MKLVFLGDSLTWGGYGGDFVAEVAKRLPNHEIINAGEGGDTIVNLLARLERDVLPHDPDGVFIMTGGNDAASYSQPATRGYYRWHNGAPPDGHLTLEAFTAAYRDLLLQLQAAHIMTWIALPPAEINATLAAALAELNQHATQIAQSLNIPVLDLYTPYTPNPIPPERPPVSHQFIVEIGQRQDSGFSDFEGERAKHGYTFSFDGLHIMPETAVEFAEKIIDFLNLQP